VVAAASEWLAFLLLGPSFRSGASLMPWIAGGYALIIVAHVFERVCFAYGQTRWVLVIQAAAAAVGMVGTAVGTVGWGLQGAAAAVPLYFAVQLAVSAYAARDTRRRAGKAAWGHASS
jgi:O-antigen/teichoic acid export membrane protein